jgi:hypothetical protein
MLSTKISTQWWPIIIVKCTIICFCLSVLDSLSYLLIMGCLNCRYHYNVMDSRLHQHADKGREDGLYISCVASSANLWAIVMDTATGYSSQVYELSPMFLHKVVITITWYHFLELHIQFYGGLATSFLLIVLSGVDNGTVGQELLHHFGGWCMQWQCLGGNVPR